ncbi:MAG: dephospho-CoA kinase [Spirochaetes bacterium GWF1_41_5]|nr:MAG: dephospho-CoA kinase [Spirochaetes bacterium GWF1_41_5]HBE04541.1 dephospho-CoA kinase [Spirochaetia bacterium]
MILGITGLTGSGKSAAAGIIQKYGFILIDLDLLGHEILAEEHDRLVQIFGTCFSSGGVIIRTKLGKAVFASPRLRRKLNAFMFPLLKGKTCRLIAMQPAQNHIICGALLQQIGLSSICDLTVCLRAGFKNRRARLKKRHPDLNIRRILQRLSAQKMIKKLLLKTDILIENNGTMQELEQKIYKFLQNINEGVYG